MAEWDEGKHPRADDGKFGDGAGASKKGEPAPRRKPTERVKRGAKFNAAPHEKKIAKFRTQEARVRMASIDLKSKMAAVKQQARAARTPAARARLRARFEKMKGRRDVLKAKAKVAKDSRLAARKEMAAARKEHRGARQASRSDTKVARQGEKQVAAKVRVGRSEEAIRDLGGDPKLAEKLMTDWNTDKLTLSGMTMTAATASAAGGDPRRALDRAERSVAVHYPTLGEDGARERAEQAVRAAADPKMRSTVEALAKVSQAAYLEDEVTLYRGIEGAQAQALRAHVASGSTEPFALAADALASFTEDRTRASAFAQGGGLVVKVIVPRASIRASHRVSKSWQAMGDAEVLASPPDGGFRVAVTDVKERPAPESREISKDELAQIMREAGLRG